MSHFYSNPARPRREQRPLGRLAVRTLITAVAISGAVAFLFGFDSHDPEFDVAPEMVAVQMDRPVPTVDSHEVRIALAHDVWSADESAGGTRPDAVH